MDRTPQDIRLCHVGLGPLGRKVLADFIARELGTICAVIDVDPSLVGRSLSSIIDGAPDVEIVDSIERVRELEEINTALVTTQSDLSACRAVLISLLSCGIDIVSSCEELLYPNLRHSEIGDELDRVARVHEARVLGTGVNPGFLMDALPLVMSGVCHRVDSIRVSRTQDASTRRVPFQAKIGATLSVEEFQERVDAGTLRHVGLGESLYLFADTLGIRIDRWEETLEPIVAEDALECELGPIPAGHARGVLQVAHGYRDDHAAISLEFRAAIGEPDPADRISLRGEPDLDLVIEGGVHGDVATSAMLLNAIPALRAAQPGLHTMATIRPPHCVR